MMMAGSTLWQFSSIIVLAALSVFNSICLAEVRVIVEYAGTDHRLVRVVELPPSPPAPMSDHLVTKAKQVITPTDAILKVKLLWFGANGDLISTALMNDPRITHAPLSGGDQSPTVIGLDSGAFVVSGPSESAVLEIHLPANAMLGLDKQFWRMMLVR